VTCTEMDWIGAFRQTHVFEVDHPVTQVAKLAGLRQMENKKPSSTLPCSL